jgi:THO complex subunit 4
MNQSLDTIMAESKSSGAGRRRGRGPRKAAVKSKAATTAVIAPSGGVQKQTRGGRGAKPVALPQTGESKISVSNLPEDVNEQLIKV